MKKLIACMYIGFLTIQLVALQGAQAPRAAVRLSRVGTQGFKRLPQAPQAGRLQPKQRVAQYNTIPLVSGPQQSFFRQSAQQAKRFVKENPLKTVVGVGIGVAAIMEAQGIADIAPKVFNMAMFDDELISDEFSNAIVLIFNTKTKDLKGEIEAVGRGSAFIIRSEQNPDLYFVLTAAHCVIDQQLQIIGIKNFQKPGKNVYITTQPIIVDLSNDVAVLLIPPQEIKKFERFTGRPLPAIPAKQLSRIKPYKKEALVLQGYPEFIPHEGSSFYRGEFISEGPAIWQINSDLNKGMYRSGEELSPLHLGKSLRGASGSPVIAIRDKQPQIVGIASMEEQNLLTERKLAAGTGELPRYLQEAEKNVSGKTWFERLAHALSLR